MVPLRAYFTSEAQGVHDLLLALLDFFHGGASFQAHLEVEAYDFEDLFVGCREAHVLFVSGHFGLTLDYNLYLFILGHNWIAHVLRVLEPVLDVLGRREARLDLAGLVRDGVDHFAVLEHVLLLEELAVRGLLDALDALDVVVSEDEDHDALGDDEGFELAHGQHHDAHDVVVLLHEVEYSQQPLDLDLVDLVGIDSHGRHQ